MAGALCGSGAGGRLKGRRRTCCAAGSLLPWLRQKAGGWLALYRLLVGGREVATCEVCCCSRGRG
jgi:hypothetical protein